MAKAPVFVKIEDYKDITDIVELTREKLTQAKDMLGKIAEIKANEDAELAKWADELADVEQKVDDIDKTLTRAD
jgi:hypothetical protein